jgi:uncharacterized protein (DUF2141 family)
MKTRSMKHLKALAAAGLFVFSAQAFASPAQIRVQGLRQDEGSIVINLFASADSWASEVPDKIVQISPLQGNSAAVTVDLPPGTYAFFLYHDEDGNGELKRGSFGLPGEPYAFSNNVRIGLSKPSFQKMKFVVPAGGAVEEVRLILP